MSETTQEILDEQPLKTEPTLDSLDFEAKQNLLGFFDLLLKIDMRNNPEIYKKKVNEQDENNRNTNNTD